MITTGGNFETFSVPHIAAMSIIAAVAIALPLIARAAKSPKLNRAVAVAIAVVLIANELVLYASLISTVGWNKFVKDSLPLHICGVGVFLVTFIMFRPNLRLYELAWFWTIGGTAQAMLTPNLQHDFPSYWFIQFFISHGLPVAGVIFATFVFGLRPGKGAVLRVFIITNIYMIFIACVNLLLGSNYMFLCRRPEGASPLFFLPWPWYILFLEAVGLAICVLLYLPFVASRKPWHNLKQL